MSAIIATHKLEVNGFQVDVSIKNIKNLHLTVNPPDGRVVVSAPPKIGLEQIKFQVIAKSLWIKSKFNEFQKYERENKKLYVMNESHYIFGNRYLLKIIIDSNIEKNKVCLINKKYIGFFLKKETSFEVKKKLFQEWEELLLLNKINEFKEKITELHNFNFKVRKMKKLWYSKSTKNIILNRELVKKEDLILIDLLKAAINKKMYKENIDKKNFLLLNKKPVSIV